MPKVTISTDYEKATLDLAEAVGRFVVDLKISLSDGYQPGKDTVAIIQSAVTNLVPVLGNFSSLPAELKEDESAFIMAWLKAATDTYKKLIA